MPTFDPQTSTHIDPETGQITAGGAARNLRIAKAGGQDNIQKTYYDQGYLDGHADGYAEGYVEGHEDGATQAYNRVDQRLKNIETALSITTK